METNQKSQNIPSNDCVFPIELSIMGSSAGSRKYDDDLLNELSTSNTITSLKATIYFEDVVSFVQNFTKDNEDLTIIHTASGGDIVALISYAEFKTMFTDILVKRNALLYGL